MKCMKAATGIMLVIGMIVSCGCALQIPGDGEGAVKPDETEAPEMISEQELVRLTRIYQEWYDEVVEDFGLEPIGESIEKSGVGIEYRVLYNPALLGYYYYAVQVFEDGSGRFVYKIHHYEDFDEGKMVVNEAVPISMNEVDKLLAIVEENRFWEIPAIHPDEDMGCDGTTVFIEGYENSNTHFIAMWEPTEQYGIYRIFAGFEAFAEGIIHNPLLKYEYR